MIFPLQKMGLNLRMFLSAPCVNALTSTMLPNVLLIREKSRSYTCLQSTLNHSSFKKFINGYQ